jgi:hypothetical protein
MIPVQAITRGAQGDAVANLQDALLYWLGRQNALLDLDRDTLIKELTRLLTIERRDSVYKDSTVRTVAFFQQQMAGCFQLKASGDVDDATALYRGQPSLEHRNKDCRTTGKSRSPAAHRARRSSRQKRGTVRTAGARRG